MLKRRGPARSKPEQRQAAHREQTVSRDVLRRTDEEYHKMIEEVPQETITHLKYVPLSDRQIKSLSVVSIRPGAKSEFGVGSINDPRMGTTKATQICSTCAQPPNICSGHLGHIELPYPILNPISIKELAIFLSNFCYKCGEEILIPEAHEESFEQLDDYQISEYVEERVSGAYCVVGRDGTECKCEGVHYLMDVKETTATGIPTFVNPKKKRDKITVDIEVLREFAIQVSDKSLERRGMTRDHVLSFFRQVIPVIPPLYRMSMIIRDTVQSDYITNKYNHILSLIEAQTRTKGDPRILTKEIFKDYKSIIAVKGAESTSHTERTISHIMGGKMGLVRRNAGGKTVEYVARSVVGPTHDYRLSVVEVPREMRDELTIPVKIFSHNRNYCQQLLREGEVVRYAIKEDTRNSKMVNERNRDDIVLKEGDIVYRKLRDGDIAIFNRQPTLWRYSIMGFRVKLVDRKNFGLHLAATPAFNADFDGDEMNLHVIQTLEAQAEVMYVSNVEKCLLSNASNNMMISNVLDARAGAYLISRADTMVKLSFLFDTLTKLEVSKPTENFLSLLDRGSEYGYYIEARIRRGREYEIHKIYTAKEWLERDFDYSTEYRISGRHLISIIFPPEFDYITSKVKIRQGILVDGVLSKSEIGGGSGSIPHLITLQYGEARGVQFIEQLDVFASDYLQKRGLSIGLDDCRTNIPKERLDKAIQDAEEEIAKLPQGRLDPYAERRRESQITSIINSIEGEAKKGIEAMDQTNNAISIMSASGSKGNEVNAKQISFMMGQQHYAGKRMPAVMTDQTRSLPYFEPNSTEIAARGFIASSFLGGMKPPEFVSHITASRDGVADTALRTGAIGSAHSNFAKRSADAIVVYDQSVRTATHRIFQFRSGGDGFSPERLITHRKRGQLRYTFTNFASRAAQASNIYRQQRDRGQISIRSPKITHAEYPYLTKFEMARVIGLRAEEIADGSPVLIETDEVDAKEIAIKELYQGVLPYLITRVYPDGKQVKIPLTELIIE